MQYIALIESAYRSRTRALNMCFANSSVITVINTKSSQMYMKLPTFRRTPRVECTLIFESHSQCANSSRKFNRQDNGNALRSRMESAVWNAGNSKSVFLCVVFLCFWVNIGPGNIAVVDVNMRREG